MRAFGINVPLMMTLTYGFGVALAGFAGVLAAPIYQVNPLMGSDLIIVVFAIVVIGGMGSILGSIVTGLGLGVVEGLTKVFYPEASSTVIFVIMAIVLLIRPAGCSGGPRDARRSACRGRPPRHARSTTLIGLLIALGLVAPFVVYPIFLMKALCFALFACAFNLLLGYVGLLSFGHAAFFGWAAYVTGHGVKAWGLPPELAILAGTAAAPCSGSPSAGSRSAAPASISP